MIEYIDIYIEKHQHSTFYMFIDAVILWHAFIINNNIPRKILFQYFLLLSFIFIFLLLLLTLLLLFFRDAATIFQFSLLSVSRLLRWVYYLTEYIYMINYINYFVFFVLLLCILCVLNMEGCSVYIFINVQTLMMYVRK